MSVQLTEIVPLGRSRREYDAMFALTEADMCGRILGCADGPASFNAEATGDGCDVVSLDPIYDFSADQIRDRFVEVADGIFEQVRATPDNWVWSFHADLDELMSTRRATVETFARDFRTGRNTPRYIVGELPRLPFADEEFDLALCSHFLFLYSDQLSTDFHIASIIELLRVAREMRIFPLVALDHQRSPHLDPVFLHLASMGFECEIVDVAYELQRGANQVLRVLPSDARIIARA